jgi:hypothetical protein
VFVMAKEHAWKTIPASSALTARKRKAKAAWRKEIRRLMRPFPDCLAIAVDYHC